MSMKEFRAGSPIRANSTVNPAQARELLTPVTYVGRSRGLMLAALFACMYFGGLRLGEAAGLRRKDCRLPATGWGLLTLEKTKPQSNKRFTDSGETHADHDYG
jgi:integrase